MKFTNVVLSVILIVVSGCEMTTNTLDLLSHEKLLNANSDSGQAGEICEPDLAILFGINPSVGKISVIRSTCSVTLEDSREPSPRCWVASPAEIDSWIVEAGSLVARQDDQTGHTLCSFVFVKLGKKNMHFDNRYPEFFAVTQTDYKLVRDLFERVVSSEPKLR